jgi:hypothetical protein
MEHPVTMKIYVPFREDNRSLNGYIALKMQSHVPLSERGSIESGWAISGIVIPLEMAFMNFA